MTLTPLSHVFRNPKPFYQTEVRVRIQMLIAVSSDIIRFLICQLSSENSAWCTDVPIAHLIAWCIYSQELGVFCFLPQNQTEYFQ